MTILGYSIPRDREKGTIKPYDKLTAPPFLVRAARVRDTQAFSRAGDDWPLLVLDLDEIDGFDGAPVFNNTGSVVGLLHQSSGGERKRYVVLSGNFSGLVTQTVRSLE